MTCVTPSFEAFGAGDVQVRCSLRGDSFTTTYKRFTFFNVTHHYNCVAFGPALIDGAPAEAQAIFHIQAVDTENKYRLSGGDQFLVCVQVSTVIYMKYFVNKMYTVFSYKILTSSWCACRTPTG
jgi:hypothetical protein